MNLFNIRKTFSDYKSKGWDRIFVLVDVHGTIIPIGQHAGFSFINPIAKEVLQWMTKREEIRLILWTSSYPSETERLTKWLLEQGIKIDYINTNPEAKNTDRACFQDKPYYNIVFDDRAGFDPDTDWFQIRRELELIGEWVEE
jgi:hypothetical protein